MPPCKAIGISLPVPRRSGEKNRVGIGEKPSELKRKKIEISHSVFM